MRITAAVLFLLYTVFVIEDGPGHAYEFALCGERSCLVNTCVNSPFLMFKSSSVLLASSKWLPTMMWQATEQPGV